MLYYYASSHFLETGYIKKKLKLKRNFSPILLIWVILDMLIHSLPPPPPILY